MSLSTQRAALAAALTASAITPLTGYAYRPVVFTTGDAWPLLDSLTPSGGYAFEAQWRVVVYLGADEVTAQMWCDTNITQLVQDLIPTAWVDEARPMTISTSAGDAFALQLTVRSES